MFTLQSKQLLVTVDPKGAELKSVHHRQHKLDYMWDANPSVWGKTSPVLFPIVGTLKGNQYRFDGKVYNLPRHGFAREKFFTLDDQTDSSLALTLCSSEETKPVYPFDFVFTIRYTLVDDLLQVEYAVTNQGSQTMYFSVGGHPAFKLPLVEDTAYDDYTLRFEKPETVPRWPISKDGLIEEAPIPLLNGADSLPLSKTLFQKDAVVLKHLQSRWVEVVSDKTPHGLRFSFDGFPFLGLWAAPGADFLCIEPWCGIADSVNASGELTEKEGILSLPTGERFSKTWSVRFF